jgi:hypothetical protein
MSEMKIARREESHLREADRSAGRR